MKFRHQRSVKCLLPLYKQTKRDKTTAKRVSTVLIPVVVEIICKKVKILKSHHPFEYLIIMQYRTREKLLSRIIISEIVEMSFLNVSKRVLKHFNGVCESF